MKKFYSTIRMIHITEPPFLIWMPAQIIISSIIPILTVYAPKLIIEALIGGKPFSDVLHTVLLYGALLLVLHFMNTYLENRSKLSADRFMKKLRYDIGKITMSMELSEIERAETAEVVNLAKKASTITETLAYLQRMISNAITVVGLSYIIARLDFLFLITVLIVVGLKSLFTYFSFRYQKNARLLTAQNERVGNYLHGVAYFNPGGAKEIRVGNHQNWFMNKIKAYRNQMVTLQYRDFKNTALFDTMMALAIGIQSFIVLFLLSVDYLEGDISIADFTLYFTAVTILTSALSVFSEQLGLFKRKMMTVSDYNKLLFIHKNEKDGVVRKETEADISSIDEIVFEDVTFTYPNTKNPALREVNITIKKGEKLVIVGPNGAGKSTFIKLLCKFYKPTSGRITLNGFDIWSIPNSKYYIYIAAVFQDNVNFAFSLLENVSMFDSSDKDTVSKILYKITSRKKYSFFCGEVGINMTAKKCTHVFVGK
ncbi:MAG: ABC transporter ATP-binding protein [Parabacteroides sp.]|nr:ABC transporter ATP-binding protein [Parabacteroides sp.]